METGDCGNLSSKTMAIFKEYLVVILWFLISILNILFCISVYFCTNALEILYVQKKPCQ